MQSDCVYVYATAERVGAWHVSVGRIGMPLVVVGQFDEALDIGSSIATSRKIRTAGVVYVQRAPGGPLERVTVPCGQHADEGGAIPAGVLCGPQDRSRVNLQRAGEVSYWCARYACTDAELRAAVRSVGAAAAAVEACLAQRGAAVAHA